MIKIRLEKWGQSVVMQVLEQSCIDRGCGRVFTNEDMILFSGDSPELVPNEIFIRGSDYSSDKFVVVRNFYNNDDRDVYYERIVKLFRDYNNRNKQIEEENNIFILE